MTTGMRAAAFARETTHREPTQALARDVEETGRIDAWLDRLHVLSTRAILRRGVWTAATSEARRRRLR